MIEQLGWDADWQRIFEDQAPPDTRPARVTRIDKGGLTVNTELNSSALAVASSGSRGNAVGDSPREFLAISWPCRAVRLRQT